MICGSVEHQSHWHRIALSIIASKEAIQERRGCVGISDPNNFMSTSTMLPPSTVNKATVWIAKITRHAVHEVFPQAAQSLLR